MIAELIPAKKYFQSRPSASLFPKTLVLGDNLVGMVHPGSCLQPRGYPPGRRGRFEGLLVKVSELLDEVLILYFLDRSVQACRPPSNDSELVGYGDSCDAGDRAGPTFGPGLESAWLLRAHIGKFGVAVPAGRQEDCSARGELAIVKDDLARNCAEVLEASTAEPSARLDFPFSLGSRCGISDGPSGETAVCGYNSIRDKAKGTYTSHGPKTLPIGVVLLMLKVLDGR
ncbi:hypothetical protein HOY82DRAFT_651648 [Tuber indicum]|nr:hypothetical protein HOY82DRAFT_651648 [Tuber indicum]